MSSTEIDNKQEVIDNIPTKVQSDMAKNAIEKTLILIRPRVARDLKKAADIHKMLKQSGLKPLRAKSIQFSREKLERFYPDDVGKSYWEEMVDIHTKAPSIAIEYEGVDAITKGRELLGNTRDPAPGTIRDRYSTKQVSPDTRFVDNGVHGSDSDEAYNREDTVIFPKS